MTPADDIDCLFQPFALRSVSLRNRIVMAPMTRKRSTHGIPGAEVAAYYRRRAEGGVGLIITEGVGVGHPAAVDHPGIPWLHGEGPLAGWRQVVQSVQAAGAAIFPQLWHQGGLRDPRQAGHPDIPGLRPSGLWGTPGRTSYDDGYIEMMRAVTKPMSEEQISDVVAAYAQAARNAVGAGFDGIALHGAHGYLIDSFFWSDTNKRTDRFGGSPLARARFGAEVVKAIRAEIGGGIPIIFRFSQHKQQDYDARFAETPGELGIMLGALADAGVDLFDASSRRFNLPAFEGSHRTLAGWARHLTGKPSMAVGGVGLNNWLQDTYKGRGETRAVDNLDEVRQLLSAGMFDLVAVGRALINDPAWAAKVQSGEPALPYDAASLGRLG